VTDIGGLESTVLVCVLQKTGNGCRFNNLRLIKIMHTVLQVSDCNGFCLKRITKTTYCKWYVQT